MKKSVCLFLAIALMGMPILSACDDEPTVLFEKSLSPFSEVTLKLVSDVYFTQGRDFHISIEGTRECLDLVKINQHGKNLSVTLEDDDEDNFRRFRKMTVRITSPYLSSIRLDGVGKLRMPEKVRVDDLYVEINGVAELDFDNLHCDDLDLKLNGIGDVEIQVECDDLTMDSEGLGRIIITGEARHADIKSEGLGRIDTKNLKVSK